MTAPPEMPGGVGWWQCAKRVGRLGLGEGRLGLRDVCGGCSARVCNAQSILWERDT